MSLDNGFIVTLEGHQSTITEQLRLLPFSQNILCLPPLELPPAPPVREKLDQEEGLPPLDPAVRQFILSLHHAHVDRLAKAKAYLADGQKSSGERMVFLNGGFAAAQVACLETLRTALMSEENGNLENASREAEWVFEDIMQGGVQGLLDQDELEKREREREQGSAYGTVEIGHIPSDVESISEKMERNGMFERELFPHQLEMTPETTPETTPRIPEERCPSPQKLGVRARSKPRIVSGPRNPTLEEIAAGVEICKASVAVRVRNRSNTATHVSKYSPPPSPPIVRTEFLLGQYGSAEPPRKRSETMPSEKPKGSRRKDKEDNYVLPPIESVYSIEIPTPPSSAKVIPENTNTTQFPAFSDEYQSMSPPELARPNSRASTRPSSPTPSSTADISGATILPSPRYLSGGFDAPPQFFKEPVDPLFPSVGEHLVIYFPSPDMQKSSKPQFLEKVLGDFAASFTPQTPGFFRSNPQALLMKRNSETQKAYLSPMTALSGQFNRSAGGRESFQSMASSIATNATPPWSYRSSLQSSHHPDPPLSSIPTVTTTAEKSPAELQNEFRAIMHLHFPPAPCPSMSVNKDKYSDEDDEDDEDMRWLLEDTEIDRIWRPVLSTGSGGHSAYSAIDLIIAVGVEEDGESIDSRQGMELRKYLVGQIEEIARKKGSAWNCGGRIGLKHLLSSSLPKMRTQHPGTKDNTVLKGHFLLPELESHIAQNLHTRVLVVEFDFNTGSSAILELQRILGPDVNVIKVVAVADGVTQNSTKPLKSKVLKSGGGIRIRTSLNATTVSYSLGPNTPTTPTVPAGALQIPRKPTPGKQQAWKPKQQLISRADVLIPPFSTINSRMFIDAVEAVHAALKVRERMNGSYAKPENEVPRTPGFVKKKEEARQDTSYYLEEEETDEEDSTEKRASFRKRVKNGSKALKWLGLES